MAKFIIEDGRPVVRSDWDIDDFETRAIDIELSLTRDQIIRAMKEVADYHDYENGISWYTIDYALLSQNRKSSGKGD